MEFCWTSIAKVRQYITFHEIQWGAKKQKVASAIARQRLVMLTLMCLYFQMTAHVLTRII